MLIRRVWLGRVRPAARDGAAGRLRELRRARASFGEDQTIASDDPSEVSERLAAAVQEVGADALNLRVQLPGMAPEAVREQIAAVSGRRSSGA